MMFHKDTDNLTKVYFYKGKRVLSKPKKAWLVKSEKDYANSCINLYYSGRYFFTEFICIVVMIICVIIKLAGYTNSYDVLFDSVAFYADSKLYVNIVNKDSSYSYITCTIRNKDNSEVLESRVLQPGESCYILEKDYTDSYCNLEVIYDLPIRDITEKYKINIMYMQ